MLNQQNHDLQRKEALAMELAETLGEPDSIEVFRVQAFTYPEALLRKALTEVLAVPQEKIKKSRGALFTYLVRKYAQRSSRHRH